MIQDEHFVPSLWPRHLDSDDQDEAQSRLDINAFVPVDVIEKNDVVDTAVDTRDAKHLSKSQEADDSPSAEEERVHYVSGFQPSEYFPSHKRVGEAASSLPRGHRSSWADSSSKQHERAPPRVHFEEADAVPRRKAFPPPQNAIEKSDIGTTSTRREVRSHRQVENVASNVQFQNGFVASEYFPSHRRMGKAAAAGNIQQQEDNKEQRSHHQTRQKSGKGLLQQFMGLFKSSS